MLNNDGAASVAEEQIYPTGDTYYPDDDEGQGSIRYPSDFSYYKRRSDVCIVGHCYAPSHTPVGSCQAGFSINGKERVLNVFGDRFWERTAGMYTATEPLPFEQMALRYENSFGGEGYVQNPVGKGAARITRENGATAWPLPNIEDPGQRVGHPEHRPVPAGFGPLRMEWDFRKQKLGTYNKQWLERRWPWFPDDFDPAYFNAAHQVLQMDGYLTGNESLRFINLHPEIPDYRSDLPGIRIRCFTRTRSADPSIGKSFQEISMKLDTLWVDMDAEQLVLVWRGWSRADSEEMEDIQDILVISEALDADSMEVDGCYDLLNRRKAELEQELGEEEPDSPEDAVAAQEAETATEALLAGAEADVEQALRDAGLDPDNLPESDEKQKIKDAELLAALGIERLEENPLNREQVQARVLNRDSFRQEDLTGLDLTGIDFSGMELREADLSGLDLQHGSFTSADLGGANLSAANLTHANLRGANLQEADLTGAMLSGANLEGAVLEGAIFEACESNSAVFDAAQAAGADFSNARLRGSRFAGTDLTGASFEEADLNLVVMTDARLQDAKLDKSTAMHSNFSRADMTGVRASDSCDFSGSIFANCQMEGANFEGARCVQSNFSCADMHDANLIACNLANANLDYADLRQAKLSKARLENASMMQTNLYEASLEKAVLKGTDLRGANLYAAELLGSLIEDVNLQQANLKMTKLENAG